MIPVDYIEFREILGNKLNDAKLWLAEKEVAVLAAHKEANPTDRSAADKVLAQYKVHDEEWNEKENDLKVMERRLSTVNFCLETLQKMISIVSACVITVEMYQQYVAAYGKFFERG